MGIVRRLRLLFPKHALALFVVAVATFFSKGPSVFRNFGQVQWEDPGFFAHAAGLTSHR